MSQGLGTMVVVGSRSLRFAEVAQQLSAAARGGGLRAPTFRSPPRILGRDRSLRHRPDGSVAVAVRIDGRPFVAVVADMIDGVIAANALTDTDAQAARRLLWDSIAARADPAGTVAA